MRTRIIVVLALALGGVLAATASGDAITNVTIDSYSGRLGTTWDPSYTLDGDIGTFWYSALSAPAWVIYAFDAVYAVGDVSIQMNSGNYRKLATAGMSVSTDGVTYTPVGDFPINVGDASVTTFSLGGVDAQYVRLDAVEAFYNNWVPKYATLETASDGKFAVSFSDITFATAQGIAEAGEDIDVYDADDNGSEDVTLDGSASSYPGGSITAYDWTEGGSPIATGVSPTVTLTVGEHLIMLTVTTSDTTTDSDTLVVSVVGTPQSFANAGPDQVVIDSDEDGSESVTLDGTGSAWSTATWEWREGVTVLGSGATLQVSMTVAMHTIELHCTDLTAHSDMDTVIIDVRAGAQPPVADAGLDRTVMDANGSGDEPVVLDGSGSIDYDGTIVSWDWSEGGSPIATGVNPQVTFTMGDHTVTLLVTDNEARTDTDTVLIRVIDYVPSPTDAPYVGAWEADNLFARITAEDMAIIRSKQVLLASRSFGYNLTDGFTRLANQNSMYAMSWVGGFDVWGGGIGAVPDNVFDGANFVQYLCTHWPLTTRVTEFETQVRTRFADELDAAIIFYHTNLPSTFTPYSTTMDTLRLDYPDIKFIYVTSGVSPVAGAQANIDSNLFGDLVLSTYRGEVPIYDMLDILSTHADGTVATFDSGGQTYRYMCPEFNINADNTHPNSAFSEERMGKAMLVLLYQMFVEQPIPGDADGDGDVDLDDFVILKTNFGATSGATVATGDFDGDGDVDLDDFIILKTNFGT